MSQYGEFGGQQYITTPSTGWWANAARSFRVPKAEQVAPAPIAKPLGGEYASPSYANQPPIGPGNTTPNPVAKAPDNTGLFGNSDIGFNTGTFKAGGSALQGVGALAQGWASLKQLKLSQEAFNLEKEFANKNYNAARDTTNNRINDQNAWKAAQGRTDLSKLVV